MRWVDPADQARLSALGFSPRRPAAASAPGRHRTLARGFTRDFAQHRPYAPGDQARSVDWKVYARMDRYFVREYRAEDRISMMVVVDASASMGYYGGDRRQKFDIARRAAAGLSWIALSQGDEAGLMFVGGATDGVVPLRAGAAQLGAIDDALTSASPAVRPDGDLAASLEAVASRLPRRAAVAVISDLLGDSTRILGALRRLASGRRELLVLRVVDPNERDFPFNGPARFEGMEGGSLFLDAAQAAPAYREAFQRQEEAYRAALRRASASYALLTTDAQWTTSVAHLLAS